MISIHFRSGRSRRRLAPLWLAVAALWAFPALAADRPATPEGAAALKALIARYLPGAEAGARPLVTVTPEGSHYLISADLSALNALLSDTGVSYDPAAIAYQAVEQDDGKWRLAMDQIPRIAFHSRHGSGSLELTNFRAAALIDPAIAWLLSGSANMDKGVLQLQSPKLDQEIDFGPVQETVATEVGADGSVSTRVKEEIADIGLKATGAGEKDSPINFSARAEKALINLGVDGFKSRKAFDLWGLIAANPTRAGLAAHEAEFKGLLKELAAPGLKLEEGLEAQKAVVTASLGAIALADLKYRFGVANAGPQSSLSLNVSAEGLSLPVGLAPPNAGALTPSKIDVAATVKGVDLTAAANEWISDLSLAGEGPILSEDNADKVEAALLGPGPIRIEFAPSHVVAPALDADFAGVIHLDHDKPTAAISVHMRDFDKTMAAVKALGPDIAAKALPGLALAKGLGKTESDGSLSWLVELGADRSIKVNGIPFGKAPD
ncbi:MAG TPA: hypothetical protein VN637_12740 [Roseiarcus sp.]|nr:hypothetical protein [Roseiarcus sp.]